MNFRRTSRFTLGITRGPVCPSLSLVGARARAHTRDEGRKREEKRAEAEYRGALLLLLPLLLLLLLPLLLQIDARASYHEARMHGTHVIFPGRCDQRERLPT